MSLSIGIVGLPNVGKSTLFNALLKRQQALVASYPFATIEPNIGIVDVPDYRLERLYKILEDPSRGRRMTRVPAVIKFIDIAGLVKGAHQGEGLGNQFLSHIREVDAIVHVIRVFEDENVARAGSVSPQEDIKIINTELMMADISVLEKHLERLQTALKRENTKENRLLLKYVDKYLRSLNDGVMINDLKRDEDEVVATQELNLLTTKPILYVYNVSEKNIDKGFMELSEDKIPEGVVVCAKTEAELSSLNEDEQKEYLKSLGLHASGLDKLIIHGYKILNLETFFTFNKKEVRAWTVAAGTKAPQAAGSIHTDFERGFISAEVIAFKDLAEVGPPATLSLAGRAGGWKEAKEKGLVRVEGKNYVVKDGDVVLFRFSV